MSSTTINDPADGMRVQTVDGVTTLTFRREGQDRVFQLDPVEAVDFSR